MSQTSIKCNVLREIGMYGEFKTTITSSTFGDYFDLPQGLYILLCRDARGVGAFADSWARRLKLGHHIYVDKLQELLYSDISEIIALNIYNGDRFCLFLANGAHTWVPNKTQDIPWDQKVYKTCEACTEEIAEHDWMEDGTQCPACGTIKPQKS